MGELLLLTPLLAIFQYHVVSCVGDGKVHREFKRLSYVIDSDTIFLLIFKDYM